MGQDHVVKAMGQDHVVKAMGQDHVLKAMGQDHVLKALHLHVHASTWSCSHGFHYMPVHSPVNTRYQSRVGGWGWGGGWREGAPLRSNGEQY